MHVSMSMYMSYTDIFLVLFFEYIFGVMTPARHKYFKIVYWSITLYMYCFFVGKKKKRARYTENKLERKTNLKLEQEQQYFSIDTSWR